MISEAIILAGGLGTRLKAAVPDLPKPLAPVHGRPFISYLLEYLAGNGIESVVISSGYRHDLLEDALGDHYHGLALQYAREVTPLGTGGGIRLAMQPCRTSDVLVLNGDSFFDISLKTFFRLHHQHDSVASLAVRTVSDTSRYGAVKIDARNRITAFAEKSTDAGPGNINAGVYLLNKSIYLASTPDAVAFSIEQDFFGKQLDRMQIHAFLFHAYFIDIGIPEDYLKANRDFAGR